MSSSLRCRTRPCRLSRSSPPICLMRPLPSCRRPPAPSRPRRSRPKRFSMPMPAAICRAAKPQSSGQSFPLYRDAEVVGAPEADEDHPDEMSYVPFDIAGLMSEVRSPTATLSPASPSRAKGPCYLFEDMSGPSRRPSAPPQAMRTRGSPELQRHAVRSVYAELQPPAPEADTACPGRPLALATLQSGRHARA